MAIKSIKDFLKKLGGKPRISPRKAENIAGLSSKFKGAKPPKAIDEMKD